MALILADGRPVERFGALTTGIAVGTDVDLVFDIPAATTSTTTAGRQDGSKTSDSPPYLSHDGYPSFSFANTSAISLGADGPRYVFGIPAGRVGTLGATLANVTLSSITHLVVTGSLSQTLDPITLGAQGRLAIAGTLGNTLADITVIAAGVGGGAPGPITGTLGATLADVTLVSRGHGVATGTWTDVDPASAVWTVVDPNTTTWN